jgi:hypothetical protein
MRVVAIDPGSAKCGIAVIEPGVVLHREIVPTELLASQLATLRRTFSPTVVLLGDGTQSKPIHALLPEAILVPEAYTSQRARERRRLSLPWWRRFLPQNAPYDDLVAVILAEDWLMQQESSRSAPNSST